MAVIFLFLWGHHVIFNKEKKTLEVLADPLASKKSFFFKS